MSDETQKLVYAGEASPLAYPASLWERERDYLMTGMRDATLVAIVADMRNDRFTLGAARDEQDRRIKQKNVTERLLNRARG